MGLLSKPIKTLDDLFVHTLQDIYYAEQQITKALPKMIAKVQDGSSSRRCRAIWERPRTRSPGWNRCSRCTVSPPRR